MITVKIIRGWLAHDLLGRALVFRRLKPACLFALCLLLGFSASAEETEDPLADNFTHPPDSAKPRTWWHWVSGNVSSEGITADLQAMKDVGLGGAQIFTVDQSEVKGPVVFLSPEWRKLVHQSMVEASRLKLEISMEGCDGWSESGGHWVTPAQSMQHVVWTESQISGGQKISLSLPQPETTEGYYEDIALLAFPTVAHDDLPGPTRIWSSSTASDAVSPPLNSASMRVSGGQGGQPIWIQYAYSESITFGCLELVTNGVPDPSSGELQISDDGVNFKKVCQVEKQGFYTFPLATGKWIRIQFDTHAQPATIDFTKIRLGGARIGNIADRTGMGVNTHLSFDAPSLTAQDVIDPQSLVDLTGRTDWDAPAGKWTLVRLGHTSTGATTHPSTSPGLECDKLSQASVDSHIQHLFAPVWHDSPEQVGSTFRYLLLDSWECGCENWTPLLRDEFKKRRGYDLWPWLPTLTGRIVMNPDATNRFLWDYRRTLADLLADHHYGTFQNEAHAHGMGLASEAAGIGLPTVSDQLQCKGRTDIPMGEFWVNQTGGGNVDDPKEAASAAHIYGKPIAATESFTSIPETAAWSNDPYSLKMEGDKEFCLGVNRFVFHRYAHQPWLDRVPGMSMGPWGINFERTNTWWNQGAAWISYLSRCQYLLQQGRFVADFCYFYGEGAPVCLHQAELTPAVPPGYDYDVCNAEILLNQMTVENGEIVLKSGMRYRVLVLPNLDRMTLPVLQKIESLVKRGAVVYGPKPAMSPSLAGYPQSDQHLQSIANAVWGDCDGKAVQAHFYGKGRVAWGESLTALVGTVSDFASSEPNILYLHRTTETSDIYFVSNQTNDDRTVDCTFRTAGKAPELWFPDTAKIERPALFTQKDGTTTLPIHFDPSGSVFVIFRHPATESPVVSVERDGSPVGLNPVRPKIVIQKAIYGSMADPSRQRDVRAKIQAFVDRGQTIVPVCNEITSGDDPSPNQVKSFNVEYTLDGLPKSFTAIEGNSVNLNTTPLVSFAKLFRTANDELNFETTEPGHYEMKTASSATFFCDVLPLPQPLELHGPWQIDFQPKRGAPESALFPSLISWTDSPVDGIKYFSGTATYETDVIIPAEFLGHGRHEYLDLGEVKNLAEVTLNGKSLGILWKAPFRVDISDAATVGNNHLEIKVTNLWPNRLIGDLKLPQEQRITWASVSLYRSDSPLLRSGLLGPVHIRASQQLTPKLAKTP